VELALLLFGCDPGSNPGLGVILILLDNVLSEHFLVILMEKRNLDSLVKGNHFCVKCGSKIPFDEVGHNCELIECPKCKKHSEEK